MLSRQEYKPIMGVGAESKFLVEVRKSSSRRERNGKWARVKISLADF